MAKALPLLHVKLGDRQQDILSAAWTPLDKYTRLHLRERHSPGRSCHQASHDLRQGLLKHGIRYVIDCDVRSFFDNLQHDQLLAILRERVSDGRILELIEMWLTAGIMDDREMVFPERGSPQGSVIAPPTILLTIADSWIG